MKTSLIAILFCLELAAAGAATAGPAPALIPQPRQMELGTGTFALAPGTRIYADRDSRQTARALTDRLSPSTGFHFAVRTKSSADAIRGSILLTTRNSDRSLGPEGYELTVGPESVVIRAPEQAGLFYGVQTLLQLLPPEIYSSNRVAGVDWQAPCLHIRDWPRFKWRGLMLDVSRHFFNKSEVETVLDAMAVHKLNRFHWHLTDDQGWRIQIQAYPKLTEMGAWRPGVGFGFPSNSTTAYGPDGRYGGFYTERDIREVLAYASARHIIVIPEIEMPGHSTAALEAYPQYGCTGGPFTMPLTAGIFDGIYNPANDGTFTFLDNVLAEVLRIFPAPYVHIGGDEVPKETWKNSAACQALMKREGLKSEEELQSWFIHRIEKFVSSRGRSIIGWSEILQGGMPRNAAVMDWIGGAAEAARAGHDVVMTPTAYCYFDFYQSTNRAVEPKAATWGGPLTLQEVYSYEPMPTNLPPQLQSHILGTQGNLWTEWVPSLQHAEYMIFPRECALAEVTWSSKASRNWTNFLDRLCVHARRLDEMGVNYRHASLEQPESSAAR